jgi:hypothetical protein
MSALVIALCLAGSPSPHPRPEERDPKGVFLDAAKVEMRRRHLPYDGLIVKLFDLGDRVEVDFIQPDPPSGHFRMGSDRIAVVLDRSTRQVIQTPSVE